MPEKTRILCSCGFVNVVPGTALGSSIECFNCGAVLKVDEGTVQRSDRENASGLPGGAAVPEAPSTARSPFEDDESGGPFAPEQGVRPSSPFEDDEEETPDAVSIEAAPSGQRRVRSVFEDESEEDDAPEHESFSREAAEEQQPASAAHGLDAMRPKKPSSYVHIESESGLDRKTGEVCTRCGSEIRGDWDRSEVSEGVMCYVCSNQGTHGMPERFKTAHQRRELTADDFLVDKRPAPPPPPTPWYRDPESPGFRRAILSIAFGTVFLAAYVYFFTENTPPPDAPATSQIAEEVLAMPGWAKAALQGWSILAVFLSGLIAVYLALKFDNFLPHSTFIPNIFQIGVVLIGLTFMHFLLIAMAAFLSQIPMFGAIAMMLLPIARVLIALFVLSKYLDMGIRHLITAFLLHFVFQRVIFAGLGVFVYRALSAMTG